MFISSSVNEEQKVYYKAHSIYLKISIRYFSPPPPPPLRTKKVPPCKEERNKIEDLNSLR